MANNITFHAVFSESESTVTDVSDQGSSTNVNILKRRATTFNDDEETSSPLKKLKKDLDPGPSVPVKVNFEYHHVLCIIYDLFVCMC